MSLPPGPTAPAAVQMMRWAYDPANFVAACARRYGDVFALHMITLGRVVVVADPTLVKRMFSGDGETWLTATDSSQLAAVVGPNSLLTLQGAEHLRQRRLLLPPFHGDRMRAYRGLVEAITERELDTWPSGEPFALQPRMQAITLDVILRAVFGVDDASRLSELRQRIIAQLQQSRSPHLMLPGLRTVTGAWHRFESRLAAVDAMIYEEIERRRAAADLAERDDILSLLLQARDEAGNPMTDGELRDELITLLLAGHETTATALAWTFERLTRHPEVMARLVEEIDAGRDAYVDAVCRESLRVRPVVPAIARRLGLPATLGDREYPAGTVVAASIYLVNRHPDVYEEPAAFRPERFLDSRPDNHTWIPFGGGLRRCIGASFAQMEMAVVLRAVLARFAVEAPESESEAISRRNVTLAPKHGARVIARPRAASRAAAS